jgi:alpha-glucosidase
MDLEAMARFYGNGQDELHLALNVPFVFASLGPEMREVVERTQAILPSGAWPLWNGSNHDAGRFATRWCQDDERRIRSALLTLLTLRGTPLLYQGDEIGLPNVDVPRDRLRDPVGIRHWPEDRGRDQGRTPMPWTAGPNGGFTASDVEPWLPIGDAAVCNVAGQRNDPTSTLRLCRDAIALRRERPDLGSGDQVPVDAPDGVWAWRRGDATTVALNHGEDEHVVRGIEGTVLLGTDRRRDGERVDGELRLAPWEAVIVETPTG